MTELGFVALGSRTMKLFLIMDARRVQYRGFEDDGVPSNVLCINLEPLG